MSDRDTEREEYKKGENRRALMRAAAKGSIVVFKNLCKWLDDPESVIKEAQIVAIEYGQLDFLKYLIKEQHYGPRRSSLFMAVLYGQFEIVKYLVENHMDRFTSYLTFGVGRTIVSLSTYHGNVMEAAAECGNDEIAKYIKSKFNTG
jgi:hypothetical protein